jgi:hypothetical protein
MLATLPTLLTKEMALLADFAASINAAGAHLTALHYACLTDTSETARRGTQPGGFSFKVIFSI